MIYLALARKQRGWTQQQLGDHPKVQIHQSFISMFERGAALPMPAQLDRLANVLGLPAEKLMERVEVDAVRHALETVDG